MSVHNFREQYRKSSSNPKVITDTYTITAYDLRDFSDFVANKGSGFTITLPAPSSTFAGMRRNFYNKGAGALTLSMTSASGAITPTVARNYKQEVYCDGTYWYAHTATVSGTLTAGTIGGATTLSDSTTLTGAGTVITVLTGSDGIKIGTATTEKLGFCGAAPVVPVTNITAAKTDYTTGDLDTEAEIISAINTLNGKINSILTGLKLLGLFKSA